MSHMTRSGEPPEKVDLYKLSARLCEREVAHRFYVAGQRSVWCNEHGDAMLPYDVIINGRGYDVKSIDRLSRYVDGGEVFDHKPTNVIVVTCVRSLAETDPANFAHQVAILGRVDDADWQWGRPAEFPKWLDGWFVHRSKVISWVPLS